jgi:hypothetical protein
MILWLKGFGLGFKKREANNNSRLKLRLKKAELS